jgi:hypothetical protein
MRRALHCPANGPLVGELYFRLGGMHIDVHCGGVKLDPHHAERMPTDHQQAVVGLFQRKDKCPMLHQPAVYEEVQALSVRPAHPWRAHPPADVHARHQCVRIQLRQQQHLTRQLGPEYTQGGGDIVARTIGTERPSSIGR